METNAGYELKYHKDHDVFEIRHWVGQSQGYILLPQQRFEEFLDWLGGGFMQQGASFPYMFMQWDAGFEVWALWVVIDPSNRLAQWVTSASSQEWYRNAEAMRKQAAALISEDTFDPFDPKTYKILA